MSNVKRFGATGDGKIDDTEAIRHAIRDGDGVLHFPPGTYRVTQPLEIMLEKFGPFGIDGTSGTARILMTGAGPAFRLVGTHSGTGAPSSVKGNVYPAQRLPTIKNIEIEGAHPEADGIELIQTMQSVFEGVLIRRCRHGIHLMKRNRNLLISHSHINITGCTIHDVRETGKSQHAIRFIGKGRGNLVGMNSIGKTLDAALSLDEKSDVRTEANLIEKL